jgi:hypothetical protein
MTRKLTRFFQIHFTKLAQTGLHLMRMGTVQSTKRGYTELNTKPSGAESERVRRYPDIIIL